MQRRRDERIMSMEKKMTIKEIAKLSGVSPTAVSFVLNGKNGVSELTRQKVLSVIEMTNFVPNAASKRLTMKKSFNVALIYPVSASPFTDMFYCEIAAGLTEYLTENKYNVVFVPIKAPSLTEVPDIIKIQDADGAIFLQGVDKLLLDKLDEMDFPYIFIDIHENDTKKIHVSLDSEKLVYEAARYFISHGHEKLAFLGSDWLPGYYIRCFNGYQKALGESGLGIMPGWIQTGANDEEGVYRCMERILSSPDMPTAVCCMSDMQAIQGIRYCQEKGFHVPEDLSFIGIDDIVLSRYTTPPLTTLTYDKPGMGKLAGELLLKKIDGEERNSHIITEFGVAERKSVMDLRNGRSTS